MVQGGKCGEWVERLEVGRAGTAGRAGRASYEWVCQLGQCQNVSTASWSGSAKCEP